MDAFLLWACLVPGVVVAVNRLEQNCFTYAIMQIFSLWLSYQAPTLPADHKNCRARERYKKLNRLEASMTVAQLQHGNPYWPVNTICILICKEMEPETLNFVRCCHRKYDVLKILHRSDISPDKLCVQTCVIMPRIEVFFFEMFCFVKIRILLREVQAVFCFESAKFLNFQEEPHSSYILSVGLHMHKRALRRKANSCFLWLIYFRSVSVDFSNLCYGEFLNLTNEMLLLKTLLLSLLYMFRAVLAHHQELKKTVRAAYSDGMRQLVNLIYLWLVQAISLWNYHTSKYKHKHNYRGTLWDEISFT